METPAKIAALERVLAQANGLKVHDSSNAEFKT